MTYRYHPGYCEENAVALLQESPMCNLNPWLLMISNENRQVLMFHQSASQQEATPQARREATDGVLEEPAREQSTGDHQSGIPRSPSEKLHGGTVVWDYHAVVLTRADCQIWDLDTTAGFPLPLAEYLDASFGPVGMVPEMWLPRFRIFSIEQVDREFSSDRSHMLDAQGQYLAPPPPWPPIVNGPNTLLEWTDMTVPEALHRDELLEWSRTP